MAWKVTLLALLLGGCARHGANLASGPAQRRPGEVFVFAASSAGDAMDEIRNRYHARCEAKVVGNYAATSTLAQQVLAGATAHVFLSANPQWADRLQEEGVVAERRDLLGNRLALIVPADSQALVQRPQDLLSSPVRHVAVADPDAVPAGIHTKAVLKKLGLWEPLKAKLVSAADVRQALAMVQTGAAEAGFVYTTDAATTDAVKVVSVLDESLAGPIVYPVLLLVPGQEDREASEFYRFLLSPTAAEVFRRHGFEFRLASEAAE